MAAEGDNFFSRWSQRKVRVQRGEAVVEPPPATAPAPEPQPASAAVAAPVAADVPEAPAEPRPTLADVAELRRDSDFTRFVRSDVDGEVKNAALKKLFTDPHFNVMDGLDTYIDDYGRPDPIPESMLRQMVQSRLLGLFDHEEEDVDALPAAAADTAATAAEEPPAPLPELPTDENLDLRLQPDDAARRAGAEPGPGEDAGRQH